MAVAGSCSATRSVRSVRGHADPSFQKHFPPLKHVEED